jgi:hypothetical protein
LKPRDPRLPKPTYLPQVDLEIFKQLKKTNDGSGGGGNQKKIDA